MPPFVVRKLRFQACLLERIYDPGLICSPRISGTASKTERGWLWKGYAKNMMARRHQTVLMSMLVLTIAIASTGDGANSNSDRLRIAEQPPNTNLEGGWHFVRTPNPHGGADAISIMRTADTSRSDLDLAGLMIRCSENGAEVVVVLLRPFPLRARPRVKLGKPGDQAEFEATIAAPGTAVLVSRYAASLVHGPWQAVNDLSIRIEDGDFTIRGVVALGGLQPAFKVLMASCQSR